MAAGCALRDVDHVVFYDKPFLKFERLLETYLTFAPRGFRSFSMAMPAWLKEKLFQKSLLKRELRRLAPDFAVRAGALGNKRRADIANQRSLGANCRASAKNKEDAWDIGRISRTDRIVQILRPARSVTYA